MGYCELHSQKELEKILYKEHIQAKYKRFRIER